MLVTVELCDLCPLPTTVPLGRVTEEGHHLPVDLNDIWVRDSEGHEPHRVLCPHHLAAAQRAMGLCPAFP